MTKHTLRVWGQTAPVLFRKIPTMGNARGMVKRRGKQFRIYVDPKLKGRERLDTVIHEALHVADWTKEEEWVDETAAGIAKLLWELGYRCEKESK